MVVFYSFSEAGRKGSNQDAILTCSSDQYALFAIADGMGGKDAGADASKIAIHTLKDEFENNNKLDLSSAFRKVKDNICDFSDENNYKQMGTTLTACLLEGDKAFVGHVGDTRLYHLRGNGIISITKDQTEVQKLIDDGVLSKKRAIKYHRRNVLLSAISNYSDYSLFMTEFFINIGDRIVLTSDGAYELIKKIEIRDISKNQIKISDFGGGIKKILESREIRDDYSLVACEII